jgi:hypothetical protein
MNHDKQKSGFIPLLFPCIYFGLAAFYSLFDIYVLGNYERKHGQWNFFKITLAIMGLNTFLASASYWIGQDLLKTAPQQLPRPRIALITVLSALLSRAVLQIFETIKPDFGLEVNLILWAATVFLLPALIGVWLVKIHQSWFAGHSSNQK